MRRAGLRRWPCERTSRIPSGPRTVGIGRIEGTQWRGRDLRPRRGHRSVRALSTECWEATQALVSLTANRVDAARASGGASSDRIHEVVFAEIARNGFSGVVLDFGAGRGEFSARLASTHGFERIYAADLVRYSNLSEGVEWLEADLNDPLPLPLSSCDLIVAIEIVEHLENIRGICREWARLLRPGGRVVLTTPNNESIRAILSLIFRRHFVAFVGGTYPAHITALLQSDIRHALDEAGFTVERFFFTNEGVVPRFTRVTWQRVSRGRLGGLRFSDNFGCVACIREGAC